MVFSTDTTDCHDIIEMLLTVVLKYQFPTIQSQELCTHSRVANNFWSQTLYHWRGFSTEARLKLIGFPDTYPRLSSVSSYLNELSLLPDHHPRNKHDRHKERINMYVLLTFPRVLMPFSSTRNTTTHAMNNVKAKCHWIVPKSSMESDSCNTWYLKMRWRN
jgi:hypothetical protein